MGCPSKGSKGLASRCSAALYEKSPPLYPRALVPIPAYRFSVPALGPRVRCDRRRVLQRLCLRSLRPSMPPIQLARANSRQRLAAQRLAQGLADWLARMAEVQRMRRPLQAHLPYPDFIRRRHAQPAWAEKKAIALIYRSSKERTAVTGIAHQVDHDIPIMGKRVCGLHVEQNLRIIVASENMRKSNLWDPA